ncbi:MAG: hypothetical protein LBI02_09560 [Opitutaceae bacterium]|jgi:hypothetical protein|nr:hypothetical protein [Opitutaceae bacterium]
MIDPNTNSAPSGPRFWAAVIATASVFALFALILLIAYIPRRPESPGAGTTSELTPAERAARLAEMQTKEKTAATTYGWANPEKTAVRLPLDRAMELTIHELNAKREKQK